ncbi:LuxR C-terminal-related transcriptional regulator [Bacillus sp. JJ1764]|uniref:LuxR C-terminal-related transcriptional regulator n=1 Tax=Bacillus sp. JJ1764 TaxID=3122964 RepID=UPI002FFDA75F
MILSELEYFHEIQSLYSALTNLQISITDKKGNNIIQLSNATNIFDLVSEEENSKVLFGKIAQNYPEINDPLLYEVLPEVKIIVCPIYLEEEIEYFIYAGCMIESPSKQSVQIYLNRYLNSTKKSNLIMSLIQEFTLGEIQDKIKKIKKMSQILSDGLKIKKINADIMAQITNQDDLVSMVANDNITVNDLLQRFYKKNTKVDFMGFAKRISPVHFEIKDCLPFSTELIGTVFMIGEGILGQVAATNTVKFWEDIEWDPRSAFFHRRGIFPKSIFCFPIIHGQDILGLFFGGSSKFEAIEKEISLEVKLTASMISFLEIKMYWRKQAITYHEKNKMLNEIYQAMASFEDIKSVQMFLLDMSMAILFAKFVSVLFLRKSDYSIDIVSNGLSIENMDEYKKDILFRYFANNDLELHNLEPNKHLSTWGDKILEIPICHKNNLYGWICIGQIDDIEENQLTLLKILANAGGMGFYLVETLCKKEIDRNMIDSLVKLVEFNDPEHLKKVRRAWEILKGFGTYQPDLKININALKLVSYLLSVYDESFMSGLKNEVLMEIYQEYMLVKQNLLALSDASLNVQTLVLVMNYINEGDNIKFVSTLSGINTDLLKNFNLYVSELNERDHDDSMTSFNFKDYNILTKRENEVLTLVLEGKNNREIAENLYISGHTVKNHMSRIFKKLSVNDRSQIFAKIYQLGIQPPKM